MYQFPQHHNASGQVKVITRQTRTHNASRLIDGLLRQCFTADSDQQDGYRDIVFIEGVPESIARRVVSELSTAYVADDEGFVIDAGDDIRVYSTSPRGQLYGAIGLIRAADRDGGLPTGLMYDRPVCPLRGIHVYLPAEDQIPVFKDLIDLIVHYRYNTIILEVGGAMEYKRHPEINAGWVAYCDDLLEYPGKVNRMRDSHPWHKNSIHVENAGGRYLSQDLVRELVAYCTERLLEVIPEVPSLSHSDYLLTSRPELKERAEDPYPDTYCPSNPQSYELLHDVLDEVIDVFHPATIHIGHDEWYSIGLCDRCRGQDAPALFARDIHAIHDYLAAADVKVAMWGDKLLDATDLAGQPAGGGRIDMGKYRHWEDANAKLSDPGTPGEVMPATFSAIDLIPADITIGHWYWGARHLEHEFLDRKMPLFFANFRGFDFPDWKKRISSGAKGIVLSHWAGIHEEYLHRTTGFLFNIVYSSHMAWTEKYDDADFDRLLGATFTELCEYRNRRTRKRSANGTGTQYVEVLHTTNRRIEYRAFNIGTFIDVETYTLGHYTLHYDDGTHLRVPIIYGENISNRDVSWSRKRLEVMDYFECDYLLLEASWSTRPELIDGRTYYRHRIANPHPDRRIAQVTVEKKAESDCTIDVKDIVLH